MSEFDLGLKITSRRIAWNQGYATRLNVPLRSYVEQQRGRPGYEEYTDLDVLAVATVPSGRVVTQIFDCKSSTNRTTERAFWLKGVSEYFESSESWMVRPTGITNAARQLAGELNLGFMTNEDLEVVGKIAERDVPASTPGIERLFDPEAIEKLRAIKTGADKRLRSLIDYCSYDYWVYSPERNLSQMVAHLNGVASVLDAKSPQHHAIFLDCIWLYAHALARASDYTRHTHASEPNGALREYFHGGQVAIREKQGLVEQLAKVSRQGTPEIEPEYFPLLIEVFARMYVVPNSFVTVMRYSEVAAINLADSRRPYLSSALNGQYDVVAAKLLYDLGGFLIGSARLSPGFRPLLREIALGSRPVDATAQVASGTAEVSIPSAVAVSGNHREDSPDTEPQQPEGKDPEN